MLAMVGVGSKKGRGLSLVLLALWVTACEHYAAPNQPLPHDFVALRPDGSLLRREALLGKPWIISIWAPGCHICAREIPDIESLRLKYESQGIGFLSLSLVSSLEANERFLAQLGVKMPWVMAQGEVLAPFYVNQVPSTVFVDASGQIVRAARGERSLRSLEKQVRALKAENGATSGSSREQTK